MQVGPIIEDTYLYETYRQVRRETTKVTWSGSSALTDRSLFNSRLRPRFKIYILQPVSQRNHHRSKDLSRACFSSLPTEVRIIAEKLGWNQEFFRFRINRDHAPATRDVANSVIQPTVDRESSCPSWQTWRRTSSSRQRVPQPSMLRPFLSKYLPSSRDERSFFIAFIVSLLLLLF
jgi:hypothetical protein